MAFRCVFVPGVNEGLFPRPPAEDPLLLQAQRQALGIELRAEDTELLRIAAACASEQFTLSFSRLDLLTGRERVPSFYAFAAHRAAGGPEIDVREFEARARSATHTRIGWPAPPDPADAIDDAEFDLATLAPLVKGSGEYLKSLPGRAVQSLRARWMRWHKPWKAGRRPVHRGDRQRRAQALPAHRTRLVALRVAAVRALSLPFRAARHFRPASRRAARRHPAHGPGDRGESLPRRAVRTAARSGRRRPRAGQRRESRRRAGTARRHLAGGGGARRGRSRARHSADLARRSAGDSRRPSRLAAAEGAAGSRIGRPNSTSSASACKIPRAAIRAAARSR